MADISKGEDRQRFLKRSVQCFLEASDALGMTGKRTSAMFGVAKGKIVREGLARSVKEYKSAIQFENKGKQITKLETIAEEIRSSFGGNLEKSGMSEILKIIEDRLKKLKGKK